MALERVGEVKSPVQVNGAAVSANAGVNGVMLNGGGSAGGGYFDGGAAGQQQEYAASGLGADVVGTAGMQHSPMVNGGPVLTNGYH